MKIYIGESIDGFTRGKLYEHNPFVLPETLTEKEHDQRLNFKNDLGEIIRVPLKVSRYLFADAELVPEKVSDVSGRYNCGKCKKALFDYSPGARNATYNKYLNHTYSYCPKCGGLVDMRIFKESFVSELSEEFLEQLTDEESYFILAWEETYQRVFKY